MHLFEVKKGKKASVVDFIQHAFEDHKQRMMRIHRSWALNLAWTKGHQNVDFNPRTIRYDRLPVKDWQTRLVSNLMLPVVRANVSRLAINAPVWDVIPATPDEKDVQISRVSKMILDYYWRKLKMPQKIIRTLFWQATCCSAFMKVGWNAEAGRPIQVNSSDVNDELLTEFIKMMGIFEVPKVLDLTEGEPFLEPIPPFNMAFDPLSSVMEDSDWSIETQVRSLDWVVDTFGTKWKDKLTEDHDIEILLHPYIFDEDHPIPKKGIVTHELFVRKTKKFPKGLYCLLANEEVLVTPRDHPFEHKELPYAHFLEIYDPGSFYGTCAVEQIRPNQARYNKIQSVVTDCINTLGKPKWISPINNGITSITNSPGEVLRYRYPLKPEQIQSKPLPSYIQSTMEQIRRDMQDTSSLHNVSQGQNEPGVRSGKAVVALQSADDAQQGPTLIWFDAGLQRMGSLLLQTVNQFTTEERVIQITGEFNELETITYTGEMLSGKNNGEYFDVRVNTYVRNNMSRASRESLVFNLAEAGLVDPVRDRVLLLNMLGMGDISSIFDELAADRARQTKEIQAMRQGQKIPVLIGENHEQHLRVLKKFMASAKRDETEPENVQIIQQHLVDHEEKQVVDGIRQQIILQGIVSNAGRNQSGSNQSGSNQAGSSQASGA